MASIVRPMPIIVLFSVWRDSCQPLSIVSGTQFSISIVTHQRSGGDMRQIAIEATIATKVMQHAPDEWLSKV
jgi:hypothetical protein